jgi:septum formation protein
MPKTPLILASASPSRRQMLTNVGLDFTIEPSGVDEDEVKLSLLGERATAQDTATTLAEMKALRVSTRRPGAFVIGADSTLACEGSTTSRPRLPRRASSSRRWAAARTSWCRPSLSPATARACGTRRRPAD